MAMRVEDFIRPGSEDDALFPAVFASTQARREELGIPSRMVEGIPKVDLGPENQLRAIFGRQLHLKDATNVTSKHMRELLEIPEPFLRAVAGTGMNIHMGRGLAESFPGYTEVGGKTPGITLKDDMFLGSGKHGSVSIARHEFGHGVDRAYGRPSRSADFLELYERAKPALPDYFQGRRGAQEFFAEAFAAHTGGVPLKALGDDLPLRSGLKQFFGTLERTPVINEDLARLMEPLGLGPLGKDAPSVAAKVAPTVAEVKAVPKVVAKEIAEDVTTKVLPKVSHVPKAAWSRNKKLAVAAGAVGLAAALSHGRNSSSAVTGSRSRSSAPTAFPSQGNYSQY